MIHTNRIVTVGEQECIIDRPIVLYRGDREVEIEFTLVGNEFMFSEEGNVIKSVNASHGQLVLNTPSGEHMFSELAECHEGKVVFVVTKEMIDEFIEMGFYSFQIRLYDSAEMKSRVTIPPVMNGFDIRNPIAAEDETNVVDQGIVDYARIFKDQSNEELPTFDWLGNYNKTEWVHHDVITENKMNKIEDALYSINANIKESDAHMLNTLDQVKKDADKYVKEHMAEVEADVEEFERNLNTDVQKFKVDTNAAMTAHKNEVSEVVDGFSGEIESINSQLEHNTNLMHKVSVKNFGAKGDGINDDTLAIQNAIDYAYDNNINHVYFPSGTYNISSPLFLYTYVVLSGEDQSSTTIKKTTNNKSNVIGWEYDAVIIFSTRAKDQEGTQRQGIEKLRIQGCCSKYIADKGEDDRQYGILSVVNSPKVRIRDFLISNVDVGIKLKGAWTGFIENSYWLTSFYRAIYIYSESQGLTIKNINTASTREVGIEVRGGAYCNLISVLVEWIYGGMAYKFDSSQINMLGCGYELTRNMTCGIYANRSRIQLTSAFLEGGTSQADGYKMINLNDSFLEVITGSIGYSELDDNTTNGCLFVVNNKSKLTICDGAKIYTTFNADSIINDADSVVTINDIKYTKNSAYIGKDTSLGSKYGDTFNVNKSYLNKKIVLDNQTNPLRNHAGLDRSYSYRQKQGDINLINNPLLNGHAIWICGADNDGKYETKGTISKVESGKLTLTDINLVDSENTGVKLWKNATILGLTSGATSFVSSVSFTNNTISLSGVNGAFVTGEKLQIKSNSYLRNSSWAVVPTINSGESVSRPTNNVIVGQMYFDTTLGKPIWFKGNNVWVDSEGNTV